jgi:hypothetical protein
VLVLNNCRIHHAKEICQLVEDEARMWFFLDWVFLTHFFSQNAGLFFCRPTHQTTTQLSKLSPQSKPFCDAIGRIDPLV